MHTTLLPLSIDCTCMESLSSLTCWRSEATYKIDVTGEVSFTGKLTSLLLCLYITVNYLNLIDFLTILIILKSNQVSKIF